MENKNIIIILVAIIIVLAAIAGFMYLQSANAKQPTKIKITSDKTLYEDGKLKVQLTDLNKTALSKQKVKIIIKNKKGKTVVNKTVKTNSKGKANLDLDLKKGKYEVNVAYDGNDNYSESNATQKLTIKEEVKETTSESSSNSYPEYSADLGYYRPTGIGADEWAVVELADGRNVVIAGDGYYEYTGLDSSGYPQHGNFLGHGGTRIA